MALLTWIIILSITPEQNQSHIIQAIQERLRFQEQRQKMELS